MCAELPLAADVTRSAAGQYSVANHDDSASGQRRRAGHLVCGVVAPPMHAPSLNRDLSQKDPGIS